MIDPFATDSYVDRMTGVEYESEFDWEVPIISEEALDRLPTMFTIYPKYHT